MHKLGPWVVGIAIAANVGCGGQPKAVREAPSSPAPKVARPLPPEGCRDNAVIDEEGNLIVAGTWRGKPVKILVDTGANVGSIASELVAANTLPVKGHAKYASATGLFLDTTMHDAGELSIGGTTIAADGFFSTATHGGRYEFSLGLDQLATHAMVVDLAQHSFCLVASPHPMATQSMRIAGNDVNRDIVVSATFGDLQLDNMILDTGAGVTTVNNDLLGKLAHTELPEKAQAVDGTGQVVELPLVTVPTMCVHDRCVTDHMVMPSEDMSNLVGHHVDGIVGLPFFADHVLVLDFPAQKMGID